MMISAKTYREFLKIAVAELHGEFLVVGGAVLPLLGYNHRATVDIDFVGLGKKERAQSLEIMRIANKLGLPAEAINGAAAIFIANTTYSKNDLVVLAKGKNAVIYRPSTLFYMRLKFARMSESDLDDCKEWLAFLKNEVVNKDKKILIKEIQLKINDREQPIDRIKRFQELLRHLSTTKSA